jgi:hypothetical protein
MDENKIWHEWRYFNNDYIVTHDLENTTSSTAMNFTLNKRGLYCVCNSYYNPGLISTNGNVLVAYDGEPSGSSSAYATREYIIYSDGTKRVSFALSGGGFGGGNFIIYIGPYTSVANASYTYFNNITTQYTQTFTTHNQFIHFSLSGKTRYNRSFSAQGIDENFITISDPGTNNTYSAAAINLNGSITCTGTSGNSNANAGSLFISSYTLDI